MTVFKLTNGRIGGRWRIGAGFHKPVPTLLLEHRARKTGRLFTTPLLYLHDGERLMIVTSQGGLPKHPLWHLDLVANPPSTPLSPPPRPHTRSTCSRHGQPARWRPASSHTGGHLTIGVNRVPAKRRRTAGCPRTT